VGAENVLFAVDKSAEARLLLGGTMNDAQCYHNIPGGLAVCDIAIQWELFDKATDQVVYKKLTRSRITLGSREPVTDSKVNTLVQGALVSLLASPRFVQAGKKGADVATVSGSFVPAAYRACSSIPRSLPAEMDAVIAASVTIPTAGVGAGAFISPDGVLITAAHVVSGLDEIVVKLQDGRSLPGRVVRRDAARDIAVVRVQGAPEVCLPVAAEWPKIGDEVFAVGAPAGNDFAFSVARGIVSGTPTVEGRKMIQTDASINPGNSGGPLVDGKGRLVGVVSGKLVGREIEGMGFAVHADTALAWLGLSPDDATTMEEAGASTISASQAAIEDTADPQLRNPVTAMLEGIKIQKELDKRRSNEEAPAGAATGFGVFLIIGSLGAFTGGSFVLAAKEEGMGIACLAIGTVAFAGGITLVAVGHRLSDKLELKRAGNVAFGAAPLDDGSGAALVLGGSF
jgi:S1-C subfamily serine protease